MSFRAAFAFSLIAIAVWINYDRKGQDLPSYAIAKSNLLLPTNKSEFTLKMHRFVVNQMRKMKFYKQNGIFTELNVLAADNQTELRVRVYQPTTVDSGCNNDENKVCQRAPVLIWIHGGGWTVGSIDVDHQLAAFMSDVSSFVTVGISYRLAPEHPFPAAIEDTIAAVQWVYNNIDRYGGDPNSIYIAGESAGGNLAAAYTSYSLDAQRHLKDINVNKDTIVPAIKGVGLISAGLSPHRNFPSYQKYGEGFILTEKLVDFFLSNYIGDRYEEHKENYLMYPLTTPRDILKNYPPVFVLTSEFDILSGEGQHFAQLLKEDGVATRHVHYGTSNHWFFGFDMIPHGKEAATLFAKSLKRFEEVGEWVDLKEERRVKAEL